MEVVWGGARGGWAVGGVGDTLGDWRGGTLGGGCRITLGDGGRAGADGVGSGWEGLCVCVIMESRLCRVTKLLGGDVPT